KSNTTNVTVESGGTLSPGDAGVGTLTVGNDLTLNTGSTLFVNIGPGTIADKVACKSANIGDGVNLLGTATLPQVGAAYTMISSPSGLNVTGNGFTDSNGTKLMPPNGGPILVGGKQFNYRYLASSFRLTAIATTIFVDGGGNLIIDDIIDKDDTLTIS